MIWTPYDWLNKFYSCYIATTVSIISRHGLIIDVRHRNQPNKSKLVLYKPLLPLQLSFNKQMCISNKMEHFNYKGGFCVCGHTCMGTFKIRPGFGLVIQCFSKQLYIPLRNQRIKFEILLFVLLCGSQIYPRMKQSLSV